MEDLIRMSSASMKSPPLHHTEIKDGHVYFFPASLALGKAVIYFVEVKEKVGKKYVALDTVHDKVSFSNELSSKPTLKYFSIINIVYRKRRGRSYTLEP